MPTEETASGIVLARVRIDFVHRRDRYAHVLSVRVGEAWQELLTSREGEPDEVWPVSPPFQHASVQRQPGKSEIGLLLGSAGSSHWSMSVEPLASGEGFLFDVACRWGSAPARLGSEYICGGNALVQPPQRSVRIAYSGGECRIEALTVDGAACSAEVSTRGVALYVDTSHDIPPTVRWRYSIDVSGT